VGNAKAGALAPASTPDDHAQDINQACFFYSMKFVTLNALNWHPIMSQFKDLDLQSLVDVLVAYIKDYDKMLSSKVFTEEEFTHCKQQLAEIHAAIKEKGTKAGYSMENIYPSFPSDFRTDI